MPLQRCILALITACDNNLCSSSQPSFYPPLQLFCVGRGPFNHFALGQPVRAGHGVAFSTFLCLFVRIGWRLSGKMALLMVFLLCNDNEMWYGHHF